MAAKKDNKQLMIEIVLVVVLIILVIYALTFKSPILTNTSTPKPQVPSNLTTDSGLPQAVNDLNAIPH